MCGRLDVLKCKKCDKFVCRGYHLDPVDQWATGTACHQDFGRCSLCADYRYTKTCACGRDVCEECYIFKTDRCVVCSVEGSLLDAETKEKILSFVATK